MEKIYQFFLTAFFSLTFSLCFGQISENTHKKLNHDSLISVKLKSFQHTFDADSLSGFNDHAAKQQAGLSGSPKWEQMIQLSVAKRKYINTKYSIGSYKLGGGTPTPQAPCTNVDFETGTITGWTMEEGLNTNSLTQAGCCPGPSTRYALTTPGFDPTIPALATVPVGGGNFSLLIGDGNTTGGFAVRARQTFNVTAGSSVFIYKFAVVLEDAGHACDDQPYFNISFTDCSNNPIPCGDYSIVNTSATCAGGDPTFVTAGAYKWKDWTTRSFDLSAYIGQCVTIEFIASDCAPSGHAGWAYVDCSCQPMSLSLNGNNIPVGSTNNYICAAGTNTLCAPPGFASYSWSGTGVTGMTTQCVNINSSGTYSVTLGLAGTSCAISPVLYSNFAIITPPVVDFTFTPAFCQTTFSVPFQNTSNLNGGPPITSFTWDWGDGTLNGLTASETHTFATSGTKTVKFKIDNGCMDSITKTVVITPRPTAAFTSGNACFSSVSTFISNSTPAAGLAAQVWNWGDGTTNGTGATPSHIYGTASTYTVKLVVTDFSGCQDSLSQALTIFPKPVITFTSNPACLPAANTFTNTSAISSGTITSWAWDFDNNGTTDNTTKNPNHVFPAAGSFFVELKATSNNGCKDSSLVSIKANAQPVATFTPVSACTNANIVLNNNSSVPAPDVLTAYSWNFGTNSTPGASSNQNPPSLTYNSPGTYSISLTITANTSCTASVTRTVAVHPIPVANFSATAVCQATATVFNDLSTVATGSISNWNWDFTSDGAIDNTTQNPSFFYPASGTFTAGLTVISNNNCINSYSVPVNVWGHSLPDFTPFNVCYGTATQFTNLTDITTNPNTGTTPTYVWNFGDGTPVNTTINPIHTYTLGSNVNAAYTVTMNVTTSHGCLDYLTKTVTVYAIPTASFTADSVCQGLPTHFIDASLGNGNIVNAFAWDFLSDGSLDATGVSNPNYVFPSYGSNFLSYTVSTTPIPGLVCSNTISTLTVWVNPSPVPNFTFVNTCINTQPLTFSAITSSIPVGSISNYAWTYGDGTSSLTNTLSTSSHTYALASVYNTTLTATSNKNCVASIVKQVEVYQKPKASVTNSKACDQKVMTFTANIVPGSGNTNAWYWDFNNTISTIEANGQLASNTFSTPGSNTISLVSETDHGCRDTLKHIVYVDYVPKPMFSVNNPGGCPYPLCVTFTDNTPAITGPGLNADWKWVFGDGTVFHAPSNSTQSHCYNNASSSQSALFDVRLVVTTNQGCSDSIDNVGFITVYPKPVADYVVSPNPGDVVTPLIYFTNQSQGYSRWAWNFGDSYILDTLNKDPAHIYTSETPNTYFTSLVVLNQYGCKDTANVNVEIGPEFVFYIPNAFSPDNQDKINDYFSGKGIGIEKFDMWIYDRWGTMIFYSDDIAKGWDGKVQGRPDQVQQDVYVWKVKIRDVLGKKHDYIGHVTLVR